MADTQEKVVGEALAREFFEVVPETYETYCSLASRIALEVFRQFSIPANLVPCQIWHVAPDSNHVIGFIGIDTKDRWDGHVVCMTETLLIDAAVRSFQRDFAFAVPQVALAPRMTTPSQVIARTKLTDGCRLWWMNAPYGFDTNPPLEPPEVIADHADKIVTRMKQRMNRSITPARSMSLTAFRHGSAVA